MKRLKRAVSAALAAAITLTSLPLNAFAQQSEIGEKLGYARKGQYVLFADSDNGIQLNTAKTVINGNLYSGGSLFAYSGEVDANGRVMLDGELYKHDYTVWSSYIFNDNAGEHIIPDFGESIINSLGDDCMSYEYWQTFSGSDISNEYDVYAESGLQFCANNVTLDGTVISESYLLVSASSALNTAENGEVNLYCANGNIGIYTGNAELNGVIYAPNGTVQICGNDIEINGMIIAKEIQISAQNVTINENPSLSLSQDIKCLNDAVFAATAEYDMENRQFNINMFGTADGGSRSIYTSADGENYSLAGTTDEDEYSIPNENDPPVLYIKAVQTFDNGFALNSNIIKMTADERSGYIMEQTDSDGDGLIDFYEHVFGSNIDKADTDGDGLSDYIEVMMTATDPLYTDSDEDGTADGDEDYDDDKLTNLQEIYYGTGPDREDSDNDGLSDYDEVFVYGTSPVKADTDDDTINDGDEIALGLNPLVKDSNGNGIPDSEEKIHQTFIYNAENPDSAVEQVIVDASASNNLNSTTEVKSIMDADVMCTNVVGLVGEPFEIETTSEFDTAELKFKIDKTKLGTAEFDNLLILWYDEKNDVFVETDTVCDAESSTVSTVTTHFSKYMVVDRIEWYKAWGLEMDYKLVQRDPVATVLLIDCSASMRDRDPITFTNRLLPVCSRIIAAQSFINLMGDKDSLSVVTFAEAPEVQTGLTNDYSVLYDSTYTINSDGLRTNISSAIEAAVKELEKADKGQKRVITLLTDGISPVYDYFLENAVPGDIAINTVSFGDDTNEDLLKHIADYTGGEFFKAANSNDIIKWSGTSGIMSRFDNTDTDDDGIPDTFETGGMKISNGQIIYTNPEKTDTDDDGLKDGKEIEMTVMYVGGPVDMWQKPYRPGTTAAYYFKMISDPNVADSDNDNASDYDDEFPMIIQRMDKPYRPPQYIITALKLFNPQKADQRYSFNISGVRIDENNDEVYIACDITEYAVYKSEYVLRYLDENETEIAYRKLLSQSENSKLVINLLDGFLGPLTDPSMDIPNVPIAFIANVLSISRAYNNFPNFKQLEDDLSYFISIKGTVNGKTPVFVRGRLYALANDEWLDMQCACSKNYL